MVAKLIQMALNLLGTPRCCDFESTSMALIQRRINVVCPVESNLTGRHYQPRELIALQDVTYLSSHPGRFLKEENMKSELINNENNYGRQYVNKKPDKGDLVSCAEVNFDYLIWLDTWDFV